MLIFSSQKYARTLRFLREEGFDHHNLDKVNHYDVTALTLAVESANPQIVRELLELGANPLLPNAHGYTPLHLARSNPELHRIIKEAIHRHTCAEIICAEGSTFQHRGILYKVNRVVRGGSSSIKVFAAEDITTGVTHIIKVKNSFNGLELRNYIAMQKYIDLFPIKRFTIDGKTYTNVYGLAQQLVPGQKLSVALKTAKDQTEKDQIIYQTLVALGLLHKKRFVHRDALPDNSLWDADKQRVEFIDYDVMCSASELTIEQFQRAVINDYKRLLFGCITRTNSHIKGLTHYTNNIIEIMQRIPEARLLGRDRPRARVRVG